MIRFSAKTLPRDLLTGIIIGLVSIPISMGYAQIAGLPAVYGLYGSIFPILIFGLFSTSPQFIFGVDAAPAALIGAFLSAQGLEGGSPEAMALVPFLTLLTGLWLVLFAILRAGKLVQYISTPVMGGFISGICTTIILMQIPKLLGGSSGTGELPELIVHILSVCRTQFHGISLLTGMIALTILLAGKRFCPRVPMAVVVMMLGALLGFSGFAAAHGIKMLDAVSAGLPAWHLPQIPHGSLSDMLLTTAAVAAVIMAETLLASKNFANKNGDVLSDNREILVYGLCNLSACLTGCCPVNGSVSRTAMGEQYGGKSQVMSLAASLTMVCILLFCTGFIGFLPVPVLTAIVISALLGAVETHLAKRLWQQDRKELLIFLGAFFGVLIFGTVAGVVIGMVLSFVSLIVRTANPKRSFLGIIPGHEGFHSLERNTAAVPIQHVILYRFASNLHFANVRLFLNDLEQAVQPDTRCIIVDSGAVCELDITAADSLEAFRRKLNDKGISLYFASHIGALNDRFRALGLSGWITHGYVRRTIPAALKSAGFDPPYVPETVSGARKGGSARLEFEWAFGAQAEEEMEHYVADLLTHLKAEPSDSQLESLLHAEGPWHALSDADQEELLTHLSGHLPELAARLHLPESEIGAALETRRIRLALRLLERNPDAIETVRIYDRRFAEHLRAQDPALSDRLAAYRKAAREQYAAAHPDIQPMLAALDQKT